jgi:hypothetical protein
MADKVLINLATGMEDGEAPTRRSSATDSPRVHHVDHWVNRRGHLLAVL